MPTCIRFVTTLRLSSSMLLSRSSTERDEVAGTTWLRWLLRMSLMVLVSAMM